MNPFCPNCTGKTAVLLVTKTMSTGYHAETMIKKIKGLLLRKVFQKGGRAKYWFCKGCKSRWIRGGELIQKK